MKRRLLRIANAAISPLGIQIYKNGMDMESAVKQMFLETSQKYGRVDVLINNAGVASMNHSLLTPVSTAQKLVNTNILGTFLFCREAAKLMQRQRVGRIVNFTTVATALNLEGEAIYAATKAAVESLTRVLAREFAQWNITVNAVGPTPVKTDLTRSVPQEMPAKTVQPGAPRTRQPMVGIFCPCKAIW